jgi:micrococcal nuclease
VRSVVDGDTLHLVGVGAGPLTGGDHRVRLLEINAPETHGTVECFGPEATKSLTRLTPVGSTVRVVADQQALDKYGRPLLYIWNADGTFVNEQLVRSGAAVVMFIPPNGRYLPVMRQAEQAARDEQAGQWAACQ